MGNGSVAGSSTEVDDDDMETEEGVGSPMPVAQYETDTGTGSASPFVEYETDTVTGSVFDEDLAASGLLSLADSVPPPRVDDAGNAVHKKKNE